MMSSSRLRAIYPLLVIGGLITILLVVLVHLNEVEDVAVEADLVEAPVTHMVLHDVVVQSGDNLTKIFKRLKLPNQDVVELMQLSDKAHYIKALKPKQKLQVLIDEETQLCEKLTVWLTPEKWVDYLRTKQGFSAEIVEQKAAATYNAKHIVIDRSLFEDGVRAGVSVQMLKKLMDEFGWEIDFVKDVRKGDVFDLLYTQRAVSGKGFVDGDLEGVIYTNRHGSIRADRYTNKDGMSAFYLPDGKRVSHDFMTAPLKYTRISSHYSLGRKHPILGVVRPHHGVDLAAKVGTPVWTTGEGHVAFIGTKSGYGKTIVIQHNAIYKTLYAHMSKFATGLKVGSKVKQGQVIGYVGMTGITTGPHLHYEFRIKNQPVNPLTVKVPRAIKIGTQDKEAFASTVTEHNTHYTDLGIILES